MATDTTAISWDKIRVWRPVSTVLLVSLILPTVHVTVSRASSVSSCISNEPLRGLCSLEMGPLGVSGWQNMGARLPP